MVFKRTLSSLSLFDGTSAQSISIIPYTVSYLDTDGEVFLFEPL